MNEKSILQLYIERLRREPKILELTEDDLDEIAHHIGMTTADMERLENIVDSHRRRGQHYLEKNELEDAAIEYERAVMLSPLNSAILYEAGMVQAELWNRFQELPNLDKSVHYLEQAYKLDDSLVEAYKYFKRLKRNYLFKEKRKTTEEHDKRKLFFIISAIAGVFLIVLIFSLAQRFIIDPYHEAALQILDAEYDAGESPFFGDLPIPVTTVYEDFLTDSDKSIQIVITKSHFEEFNNTYKYTLEGVAVHSSMSLSGIELDLFLLDQMGNVVFQEPVIVNNIDFPYSPGWDIPFSREIVERDFSPIIRGAKLVVKKSYPPADPVVRQSDDIIPIWEVLRPEGIQLVMKLVPFSDNPAPEDEIPDFVLSVTNKGYRSADLLSLKIIWQNNEDKDIYSQRVTPFSPGEPYLLPGHTRSIPIFVKSKNNLIFKSKFNIYIEEISLK